LLSSNNYNPEKFEIIIHRGHNLNAPENTVAGIKEILAFNIEPFIEIDVCVTKDNIPVVFHDLSFDRLCGDPRLISETFYRDLPKRKDTHEISKLENILAFFPEQRFLLDLRTQIHPVFFSESSISLNQLESPLNKITKAIRRVLRPKDSGRIRMITANPDDRIYVKQHIPKFEIDIAEIFVREQLSSLTAESSASILGTETKRFYIRFRDVTPEIISWAHSLELKIIATCAPSRRSINNSQLMLEKCISWGMDGLITSPINQKFIETWKNL
jgi:glycerophosphoryl diester phosphodiesterase